jgi:phage minor structural protein
MYVIRYSNGTTSELFSEPRAEDLVIIDPVVHLEANKTGSFSMVVPSTHPLYDVIERRKTIFSIYRDGEIQPIFQGVCIKDSVDFYGQKTVECEGEFTYFNDSILRPYKYQNMTPESLLTAYIAEHNSQVEDRKKFTVGNVEPSGSIYCFTNMNTTLQEIQEDLLDDFGGYMTIRYEDGKKYIDYTYGASEENVQPIQLGVNLLDYQSNIDSQDIATRVVPLGATLDEEEQTIPELDTRLTIESVNDGKDYLEASAEVVNQYGIITKVVEWDNVTVPSILKAKGRAWLNDNQFENVTISATAFDLGYIDEHIKKMRLLDKVRIISNYHGMNRVFELTGMTLNLNEPSKDVFTFGLADKYSLVAGTNRTNSSFRRMKENTVTVQQVVGIVDEKTEGKQDVLTPGDNVTIVVEDEQTVLNVDLSNKQNKLESDGSIKLTDLENGHTKIGARVFWNTTAYWNTQTSLESEPGAVYVYSDHYTDENGTVPGIKIGTGNAFVVDLPFVDRVYASHIVDTLVHITDSERQFWNDKVTCYIDPLNDKNLIFSKEEEPNG